MATAAMPTLTKTDTPPRRSAELSVEEIISRARSSPAPARGALALSVLTAIPLWAAFTPLDWGPLAWFCLVPLIQLIRLPRRTRWMYRAIYAGGLVFALAALQWMRLGDVWMYPAWIALSLYVAVYFPLFVALSRVAVHTWRVPLTIAVPVVWVGLEFARGWLLSGFAWYYLAHTQHAWTKLIQISDITGAYGVSFIVALANAALAGFVPVAWLRKLRLAPLDQPASLDAIEPPQVRRVWSVAATLLLIVAAVGYGYLRRAQARFDAGPRVALVQGNYSSSLKQNPNAWPEMWETHRQLTGKANKHRPDIIVWPETMFAWPLLELGDSVAADELVATQRELAGLIHADADSRKHLRQLSEENNASMIIGLVALEADRTTLESGPEALRKYNSAVLIDRREGITGRYDKLHRVPFGEYIPLADSIPWLQRLMPFAGPVGLSAGRNIHVFNTEGYRLVPLICFEDTVPHLVREMVLAGEQRRHNVDCLVNLTNDGWFHGSSELDQHLITASFRCIETRTPMVRAVNTGISAFIDGDGIVREPEVFLDYDAERKTMRDPETGAYHKQLNAVLVSNVPLDNRSSLYVRWGDWFAALCAAACLVLLVPARFFGLRPVSV